MTMADWHTQQEQEDRTRVSTIAARDDLDEETRTRRMKRWADLADWHASRAVLWGKE